MMDTDLLTRITTRTNQRIDELFDSGQVRTIPAITVGMARMVLDVAAELARDAPVMPPAAFETALRPV